MLDSTVLAQSGSFRTSRGKSLGPLFVVVLGVGAAAILWLGYPSGLALAGAVGVGVLFLVRPIAGLLLFAAAIPLQNLVVLGDGVTGTRILGIVVFAAWLAHKLLRQESFQRLFSTKFLFAAGLFVLLALASTLWARVPSASLAGAIQLAQLLLLSVLIIDLAATWQRADMLVKALIVGACFAAILTILQFRGGIYRRAGEDIAGGVNATSVLLVTLIPFGFYLFRSQRRRIWRIIGLAYIAAAVVAVTLTFSRMNMLFLPPLLVALYWETFRAGRGRAGLVGLAALGIILASWLVPWELVARRAQTIAPYLERTLYGGEWFDPVVSGRGYHMRVGLAIATDHPIIGAGYRNYGHLFRDQYQFTVPGSDYVYGSVRSPHSSFVGVVADLGLIGLSLWLVLLLGIGVRSVVRAWRLTSQERASPAHILVRALAYSLCLQVFVYGWYAPTDQDKLFWVLLGLSVAVLCLARSPNRLATSGAGR